jgi:hypothetical protein
MGRRSGVVLALGALLACTGGRAPEEGGAARQDDEVAVRPSSEGRETDYSVAAGDCRITWTVYRTEANRGVIRHRAECGLALAEQAPLIAKVLRKVMAADPEAPGFRTLSWGRLCPDGARDFTLPVRLALAAKRSAEWDAVKGAPRGGDLNGWVRKLATEARIFEELRPVFSQSGLDIQLTSVEKVLVLPAGRLPFFALLREGGARAQDKVPFDCQTWFSVRPAAGADREAKGAR